MLLMTTFNKLEKYLH